MELHEVFDYAVGIVWGACIAGLPLLYAATMFLLCKESFK